MTGAEALAFFALEVARASGQLGLVEAPAVHPVYVHQRDRRAPTAAVAYMVPETREIHILWYALWGYDKKTLRCVARHETLHIALKHQPPKSALEAHIQHEAIDAVLDKLWKEPAQCGLVKPEPYETWAGKGWIRKD